MDTNKPQSEQKYHHYVPQFYLKLFSNNGKSIGMFRFANRKFIEYASIRNNAGREYFYGEDNKVENWFKIQEGFWANIIREIVSSERISADPEKHIKLLMCFILTDERTAHNADYINTCITELSKVSARMMKEHGQLNVDNSFLDEIKVQMNGHMLPFIQNLPENINDISDLRLILIKNTTSQQFITSDKPVARYNQVFMVNNYSMNYGLGHMGIQCFLPISPNLCLCLFDSVPYRFKLDDNGVLAINEPDQIHELNRLFVYNSDETIFYNNSEKKWRLERLVANKKIVVKQRAYSLGSGDNYLIPSHYQSVKERLNFRFFTVIDEFHNLPMPHHMAGPLRPHIKI